MDYKGGVQSAGRVGQRRDSYLGALAVAISRFNKHTLLDELLAEATNSMVDDFEAARAEVWLWDDTSKTGYLTHFSGVAGNHRFDYISPGSGPLGKAAETRRPLFNVPLDSYERFDLSTTGSLTALTVYPLEAEGRLVAVLALYREQPAGDTLIEWWTMFADIAALAAERVMTAAESHKQIQHLSLLFEATRLLNSTLDLAELLELILRIAKTEVRAERGSVFLVDRKSRELWSIVAQGLESQEIRVPFGKGVAGHVAETGETVSVEDAYALDYFDPSYDEKTGYRTRSLLCLPIRHHNNEIVGVIQLLNEEGGRFSKKDQEFLENLSEHMAMALENARLHREALEKQRMERDLALARQIQRSLLPPEAPEFEGYEIGAANEPCHECGGDYYDFQTMGPDTMLFVIADVQGKGVASALIMSGMQATLRALSMHLHSLEQLAASLNEMLRADVRNEGCVSCFLGLLDRKNNRLHYINAGHCPPLLAPADGSPASRLAKGGAAFGMLAKTKYERGAVDLHSGDVLLGYTDGLSEADDEHGEKFGEERILDAMRRLRELPAQQLVERILDESQRFGQNGGNQDDRAAIAIKVN